MVIRDLRIYGQAIDGAVECYQDSERTDTSTSGDPAVLAIIAGTGYGYTREDGIQVIPVGCLGP